MKIRIIASVLLGMLLSFGAVTGVSAAPWKNNGQNNGGYHSGGGYHNNGQRGPRAGVHIYVAPVVQGGCYGGHYRQARRCAPPQRYYGGHHHNNGGGYKHHRY